LRSTFKIAILTAFFIGTAGSVIYASTAFAAQGEAKVGVNFRSLNNRQHKIGAIAAGKSFEILRYEGNWAVVRYGGRTGYVYKQYVRESSSPVPSPSSVGGGNGEQGVATAGVNFRSLNNRNKVIGGIPAGRSFEILRYEGNWAVVRYGNQTGYVYKQYVRSAEPLVAPMPQVRPANLGTPASATPAVSETPAPVAPAPEPAPRAVINELELASPPSSEIRDPNLPGRVEATEAAPIAPAQAGDSLIAAPEEVLPRIHPAGIDTPTYDPATTYGQAMSNLNLRQSSGKILLTVPKDGTFEVIGVQGDWLKVNYKGNVGWVAKSYVDYGDVPTITEAQAGVDCPNCDNAPSNLSQLQELTAYVLESTPAGDVATLTNSCLQDRLVASAKARVRRIYGNRKRGGGDCALAVRQSLNDAGIWTGGGLGHAYQLVPRLISLGFVNVMKKGMTPKDAPNGAILVYGPKPRSVRGCKASLGNTYGHVEIKESDSSYLYDGNPSHNIQEAYGAKCRPLIGVMVMGPSCPYCSSKAKNACGG
jgi:uncharacterized protein YgiM (DUF1202 family)